MAERFAFQDPFDKRAINRVTRYRAKKRRLADQPPEEAVSTTPHATPEPTPRAVDLSNDRSSGDVPPDHDDEENCLDHEENSVVPAQDSESCSTMDPSQSVSVNHVPMNAPDDDETVCPFPSLVDEPLYDGASLTVAASNVLIMKLKMRHSLSNECVQDLLSLIKLHCPTPSNCVTSLYKFSKKFGKSNTVLHYHCNACYQSVTEDDLVCTNTLCKNNLVSGGRSSFIEIPLEEQLRTILERKLK